MEELLNQKPKRRHELDWLRVLAILVLFYFHTARIFDSLFPYYIKNNELCPFCDKLIIFVNQWYLPLFFLVAGASTWFSLEFRTGRQYLTERLKRLLIPFIFGLVVVVPPMLYYVLRANLGYQNSYLQFYSSYFFHIDPRYPLGGGYSGMFELGSLWFIVILFIFSILMLPFSLYFKRGSGRSLLSSTIKFLKKGCRIFLPGLILAVIEIITRIFIKWSFFENPAIYLTFFIYGFLLFSDSEIEKKIQKYGKSSFFFAVISTLLLFIMGWKKFSFLAVNYNPSIPYYLLSKYIFNIISGFNMWFWVIFLLYFAKKYLDFSNKILKYANQALLPFYILNQTLIVIIGFYVIRWDIGSLGKYVFISSASLLSVIIIYELFIKRINIMRILFGIKKQKRV
jgi:glucan biosynthesis protein C